MRRLTSSTRLPTLLLLLHRRLRGPWKQRRRLLGLWLRMLSWWVTGMLVPGPMRLRVRGLMYRLRLCPRAVLPLPPLLLRQWPGPLEGLLRGVLRLRLPARLLLPMLLLQGLCQCLRPLLLLLHHLRVLPCRLPTAWTRGPTSGGGLGCEAAAASCSPTEDVAGRQGARCRRRTAKQAINSLRWDRPRSCGTVTQQGLWMGPAAATACSILTPMAAPLRLGHEIPRWAPTPGLTGNGLLPGARVLRQQLKTACQRVRRRGGSRGGRL